MSDEFEKGQENGIAAERAAIVAFLRRRTNLTALATLIEARMHLKPAKEQNDYCARHKIGTLVQK